MIEGGPSLASTAGGFNIVLRYMGGIAAAARCESVNAADTCADAVCARGQRPFSTQRTQRGLTPATEPATFVLVIVLLIVIELTGVRFDYDYDYEHEHEHEHEKGSTAGKILAPREDSAD